MADNDFTSEDLAALEKHDKEIAEEFSKELHAGCAELQKQLIEKYAPRMATQIHLFLQSLAVHQGLAEDSVWNMEINFPCTDVSKAGVYSYIQRGTAFLEEYSAVLGAGLSPEQTKQLILNRSDAAYFVKTAEGRGDN